MELCKINIIIGMSSRGRNLRACQTAVPLNKRGQRPQALGVVLTRSPDGSTTTPARFLRNRSPPLLRGTLTNPTLRRLLPCNRQAMSLGLWLTFPSLRKEETQCNAYSNGIQTKA